MMQTDSCFVKWVQLQMFCMHKWLMLDGLGKSVDLVWVRKLQTDIIFLVMATKGNYIIDQL